MKDLRKHLVLVVAGSMSLLLGVQFVRMLQPAQARSVDSACKGLRPENASKVYGSISEASGRPPDAIEFQAQNHRGGMVSLSDYRGRVVLVNFWASWCNVCRAEKPKLEALQRRFDRDDLVVLAPASDDEWDKIFESLPERGTPLSVLLDPPRDGGNLGAIARAYGITAVPETFVIDRQGKLRYYFVNQRDWDSDVARTCLRSLVHEN